MAEVNKYARGKVYKIISNNIPDVYIGSTCEPTLAKRLAKHKDGFKRWKKDSANTYASSYKLLGQEHYEIILIELYPCNSKDELHKRERYYIENTPNCVNVIIPTRTDKEYNKIYREQNKDIIKDKSKAYREANKDVLNDKHKIYYEANKDKIKAHYDANKDVIKGKKKIYREQNKDKIKARKKAYYDANKDEINKRKRKHYEKNKDAINKRKRDKRALLKSNQK